MIENYKYRFKLINDLDVRDIRPLGTISVTNELIDETFFYQRNIGSFSLKGDDFNWIKAIEETGDLCKNIIIRIERKCSGDWSVFAESQFTMQNCQFINSKCKVTVNPESTGGGSCLIDQSEDELNIFEVFNGGVPGADGFAEMSDYVNGDALGFDNGNVFLYNGSVFHETLIRPKLDGTGAPTPPPTIDELLALGAIPENERDLIQITRLGVANGGGLFDPDWIVYVAWSYRRGEAKVGGICPETPPGYTLINDTGPNCIYQKKPTDEDQTMFAAVFGVCPAGTIVSADKDVIYSAALAGDPINPDYPTGFCAQLIHKDAWPYSYLTLSMEAAIGIFSERCGIDTVVSDFFQINPENPSLTNYVTNEPTHTNDIRFIQRSNAIFPFENNSSRGMMSFGSLTKILREAFNVFWTIDLNGNVRFEHYSFFENIVIGLDLTNDPTKEKYVFNEINYSYKKELLPYIENVSQSNWHNYNYDERVIKYVDTNGIKLSCVGTSTLEHSFDEFNTDLEYFVEYPTGGERNGWVMVACTTAGGGNPYILPFDGFLNGHLSIKELVLNYYQHGRSALNAQRNGVHGVFEPTVRRKEEDGLSFPVCCGDDFDPRLNIKTPNGIGRVVSSEFNLKTQLLTLKNEY